MFHRAIAPDAELRLLQPHHAVEVFTVTDRNRDRLRDWLPWVDGTRSPADSLAFIQRGLERLARDGSFEAGIFVDGAFAGVVGVHEIDRTNHKTSLGYWIGEEHGGRGLVTNACKVLLAHLFEEMGLNRVEIRAAVENAPSRAVPERLGFTFEGVAREVEWLNGRFVDHAVYSLLRAEWPESPAAQD